MTPSPSSTSSSAEVDRLLKKAVDLHTLPVVVLEAERLMRTPRTSAQDIATLISRDPALAGRILRMANSAYYGFQKRIGTLTQAIVLLGFQTTRNLMLTVSVIETFRTGSDDSFDYPGLWAHSMAAAIAASEIAAASPLEDSGEAYIAGLLHDAGKLIIAQHLKHLSEAIHRSKGQGFDELEAERVILGRSHASIGAQLAERWQLPPHLVEGIREHHHPPAGGGEPNLAHVLQLANIVVTALGFGRPDASMPLAVDGLSKCLGYDEESLAEWIDRIVKKIENASDFFELIGVGQTSET
ncbi:MAG: HDOD domain-containing protein [Planctomycetota bacterium]